MNVTFSHAGSTGFVYPTEARSEPTPGPEPRGDAWNAPLAWYEASPSRPCYSVFVVVEPDDSGYCSYAPSLPGANSWGESAQEAILNITEAIQGCILGYVDAGRRIPWEGPRSKWDPKDFGRATETRWIDVEIDVPETAAGNP